MRKSAKYLGKDVGLSPQAMNVWLKREGFIEGEPGNYRVTDTGFPYARQTHWDAGDSHTAGYPVVSWPEEILDELGPLTPELRDSLNDEVDEHNARKRREAEERRRELDQRYEEDNKRTVSPDEENDDSSYDDDSAAVAMATAVLSAALAAGLGWAAPRAKKLWEEKIHPKIDAGKEKLVAKFRSAAKNRRERPASGHPKTEVKEVKGKSEKDAGEKG